MKGNFMVNEFCGGQDKTDAAFASRKSEERKKNTTQKSRKGDNYCFKSACNYYQKQRHRDKIAARKSCVKSRRLDSVNEMKVNTKQVVTIIGYCMPKSEDSNRKQGGFEYGKHLKWSNG